MKSFYFTIPFIKGFAPDTISMYNTGYLESGKNGRILPNGVETTGPPMYFGRIFQPAFPFPQGIVVWNNLLLFHKTRVLRVLPGGAIGSVIDGIDDCNHPWSFAIFKDHILACNAKTYVWTGEKGSPTEWGSLAQQTYGLPVGTCVCAWNGQMLIGAPWAYGEQQDRWIMWTRVGSADARLEDDDTFESGYHVTEYGGTVKALYPMENGVLALSDQGVTFLAAAQHPHMYRGRVVTRTVGIHGPRAICGDRRMCMFTGTDGNIYSYTVDGHFERMGFRDRLDLPENACVSMSNNIERSEVYIGY